MKKSILITTILFTGLTASAENYICHAVGGPRNGRPALVFAPDIATATSVAKQTMEIENASCLARPPLMVGKMEDLGGKKWGFFGLIMNQFYLSFEEQQVLIIQECGSGRLIYKFNADVISENSLKLTQAGTEGYCNPRVTPIFKDGDVITFQITKSGAEPYSLSIFRKNPSEGMVSMSSYQEVQK